MTSTKTFKKWLCASMVSLSLLTPIHSMAGIEKLIKNVMPQGTMSNISKGAIVQEQLSGHIIGGSVMLKSPPIDDLQLVHAQAPTCKLGGLPCGAQLDLRAGAFSFIKAAQLEHFFKQLASNVGGYAALMAIKTVCPQCENIMTYLEQIQRSINQFNINSCDAATAMAGGIAAKMSKGAEMQKQSANVLSGRGADMADIRAKSKDDGKDATLDHPELKTQLGDSFNLVWKALETKAAGGGDGTSLKEMLMSISGTIIGKKDFENRRIFAHKKSLITNELIEDFIGAGKGGNDIELYMCDEQAKCLNPLKKKTRLSGTDTIKGSLDKLLASMIDKIKKNTGEFTPEEENLIALSSLPLINKIQMDLSLGNKDIAHLAIRTQDFLELLAFDVVTNHLTKMLHQTSEAVSELSNVQLIESSVFKQFENEVASVIRFLASSKDNAYKRFNTIEQIKARMAMEDQEFERKFVSFSQQAFN